MYRSRIIREAADAAKMKDESIILIFNDKDINYWKAYLFGPSESPFQNGIFEVKIDLTDNYPLKPPKIFFKTRVFHPNIHWETGEICLDIIKNEWTPSWTLESLCRAVLFLMAHPNAESPLNCDAGNLIRNGHKKGYFNMAKMYTMEYSIPKEYYEKIFKCSINI